MKRSILLALLLVSCSAVPALRERNAETAAPQTKTAQTMPRKASLPVPFTVQAPFADWNDPYQEACEEAALLMVHAFLSGNKLSKQQANEQLLAIIKWETANGYPEDVTIGQLADIAERYFGYAPMIVEDPSADDIRRQIAQGNPVIVPAAGRMLGNPYFSGEGPWYHMLVVTGYDGRRFITNDPGTRRGEGYRYRDDVLLRAIHDWTGVKEEIGEGKKRALVLLKKKRLQ